MIEFSRLNCHKVLDRKHKVLDRILHRLTWMCLRCQGRWQVFQCAVSERKNDPPPLNCPLEAFLTLKHLLQAKAFRFRSNSGFTAVPEIKENKHGRKMSLFFVWIYAPNDHVINANQERRTLGKHDVIWRQLFCHRWNIGQSSSEPSHCKTSWFLAV